MSKNFWADVKVEISFAGSCRDSNREFQRLM